jgi:quinolinate synthase
MNSETVAAAKNEIERNGFLDIEPDPSLDLFAEIERLKKEKMPFCWRITTRSRTYRM